MSGCLGAALAALVDGELDHAARERAQRHLAHCAGCRADVEEQRRVKAGLRTTTAPPPSDALTARLLALGATSTVDTAPAEPDLGARQVVEPLSRDAWSVPVDERSDAADSVRRAAPSRGRRLGAGPRPAGAPAPAGRPSRALGRRVTAGSAFALLGVAAALALGAPAQRPPSTTVDPTSEAFLTDFASVTEFAGVPQTVGTPGGSTSARQSASSVLPFVPVTRAALMTAPTTAGGVGGGR